MSSYILLFIVMDISVAVKDGIPVFILDFDNIMKDLDIPANPFVKLPSETFTSIIELAVKETDYILIFLEDILSTEDISTRDDLGTPYANLQIGLKEGKVKYITSVSEPYSLIKSVIPREENRVLYLSPGERVHPFNSKHSYYLHFIDLTSTRRTEVLRSHDGVMMQAYYNARQLGRRVVGFYTGRVNPIVLEKPPPVPTSVVPVFEVMEPKEMTVMLESDGGLFKFSAYNPPTLRSSLDERPMIGTEVRTRRSMSTSIQYSHFDLQFNFIFLERNWLLDNVLLLEGESEVARRAMGVGAPWNWSYVCGEPLSLVNNKDGSIFIISNYQIQPRFKEEQNSPRSRREIERRNKAYELTKDEELPVHRDEFSGRDEVLPDKPWLRGSEEEVGDDPDQSLTTVAEESGGGSEGGSEGDAAAGSADSSTDSTTSSTTASTTASTGAELGGSCGFGPSVDCRPNFTASILSAMFIACLCLCIGGAGILVLFNCNSNSRFDDPNGKGIYIQTEAQ